MRIEWLYEARCEFEEQLAYYRSRGGAEAAAGFAGKILGAVERLAAAPRAGVLRRETLLGKHGFRALLVERTPASTALRTAWCGYTISPTPAKTISTKF